MKSAFDEIMAGMEDALAFAEGDTSPGVAHVPAEIDVRAIRKALGLEQAEFAAAYGFGLARLRDWEQGGPARTAPRGPISW